MTLREARNNGTLDSIGKRYVIMDIHKKFKLKMQNHWDDEIDHIETREKFNIAIVVMRVKNKCGLIVAF